MIPSKIKILLKCLALRFLRQVEEEFLLIAYRQTISLVMKMKRNANMEIHWIKRELFVIGVFPR